MGRAYDLSVFAGIGLLAALVVVNSGTSCWNTYQVYDDASWAIRAEEVLDALGGVRANVSELGAAQRTYLLTGEEGALDAFRAAETRTPERLAKLSELTTDPPDQRTRAVALEALIGHMCRELSTTVAVRQQRGLEAGRAALAAESGSALLAQIDRAANEIEAAERVRLRARRDGAERAYSAALRFEAAAACLGLVALAVLVWLFRRSTRARAAATAHLWEQREWLRTTLTSIGDAVIATDPGGRIVLLNPVAEALTGWATGDAAGRPLEEVFHIVNEATRASVESPARRALKDGLIVGLANHTVLIGRDGVEHPIDDSAAPIRAPDGGVRGAVLVFRDVTARKCEEDERGRLAETLRLAMAAADLGTWSWDAATGEMTVSDRAAEIYGVPPGRAHSREEIRALLHPAHWERARAAAARAVEVGADYDIEYLLSRPGQVWVSARGRGVYSGTGQLVRMIGVVQDISARKAAEAALRESEGRQRFLADLAAATQPLAAPDAIMAVTARLLAEHLGADRCAYAEVEDESVFVVTGDYSPGIPSMVGRWPVAAFGPECDRQMRANEPYVATDVATDPRLGPNDRPAYAAAVIGAAICVPLHKNGRLTAAMAVHQAGARTWTPAEVELVTTVVGRCWEALERARAVDAERRLHAEVAAERNRLEEVFRSAPSFMAVLRGPDHVFEWANDRFRELVGGRELVGRALRAAVPEIEGQGLLEVLDRVYRTGVPWHGAEARVALRGKGGAPEGLVLEFVYQPMRDAAGAGAGILIQGIDRTEHKRAEANLARVTAASERQRRLYETILSNTPDFMYVFSLDHRVAYANDALTRMWGCAPADAVGKTFLELGYEPRQAAMHVREIDRVRDTKLPIRGEGPFTGTGEGRIYDYIFVPVIGADGEVEAVAGTTRDITDRQAMEQELRGADRRKDEFIAMLAHELRNPLAPIRNALQLLRLGGTDPGAQDRARAIMDRQLTHMVRLVDDLLDASRISRNKMELRRTRVPLAEVIASAVETARPALDESGLELVVSLSAEPIYLDADLTRLAQVFSNLLTNSAKYTPRGGRVWVSAGADAGQVVVSVRDTGIGIPAQAMGTIFDMFSQVDRTTERNTGGLGIGLALVKGLVEMHGGTVTVASEGEGRGSTFTVTLPAPTGGAAPVPGAAPEPAPRAAERPRRVLVVDDNRDGAESMAEVLGMLGNEVQTAHDGLEAVAAAEAFRPEVILMDVGMPKLNGLDATRRIRARPWGRGITIIALTGWGKDEDRERTRAAGCDGHLVKPVGLAEIEKLLGGVYARDGASSGAPGE